MGSSSTKIKPKTPQEKGYIFEKIFGKILGVKPTRGSGNQWFAKFDLASAHVLFSLKHTDSKSYRIEKGHLDEILFECTGDQEPAMAISIQGEVYVLQRAGDWVASRQGDADTSFIPTKKYENRRRMAKIPALLRGNPEDEDA